MVDIISKRDGPRREDLAARRVLSEHRGTINRIMDHLTGGQPRGGQQPPAVTRGLIIHGGRAAAAPAPRPYVRISINGRVVVVDQDTSRQLHFLGEIRGPRRDQRFVLATRENGFFALIEDALRPRLAPLDGRRLGRDFTEDDLARAISERLGFAIDQPADSADG